MSACRSNAEAVRSPARDRKVHRNIYQDVPIDEEVFRLLHVDATVAADGTTGPQARNRFRACSRPTSMSV